LRNRAWFRRIVDQRRSLSPWPDEAYARAQYHLAKVLLAQDKDAEMAKNLQEKATEVLHRLLPMDLPSELAEVTDEVVLFDHMLPISPGGPRYTGVGLLELFMRKV
jgi:hypothetical protein